MNYPYVVGPQRAALLNLWRLKCRRASSAQNHAAMRTRQLDDRLTMINIFLSMMIFVLGLCNSLQAYFQLFSKVEISNFITIATGLILCSSYYQFSRDFKGRSYQHRQSGHEYGALAQEIEMVGCRVDDDLIFAEIGNRFERVHRTSTQVPDSLWKPFKDRFHHEIIAAEKRMLPPDVTIVLTNNEGQIDIVAEARTDTSTQ